MALHLAGTRLVHHWACAPMQQTMSLPLLPACMVHGSFEHVRAYSASDPGGTSGGPPSSSTPPAPEQQHAKQQQGTSGTPTASSRSSSASPHATSKREGNDASSALATSIQGLIDSVHLRASVAQSHAQTALSAVRDRVQRKLSETPSSSMVARQQDQQPLSSRVYSRLQGISRAVNQLTGYTTVEHLKEAVAKADEDLIQIRQDMERKKQAYEDMLETQLNLQRDLNALLQKKSSWVDQDVLRFTELCRMEHKTDADVAAAREAHEKAADDVDAAQVHLFKAIRERYTEEQLWGDKIRRTATWWTWGLMGLQMLSFMGVILVIEPRRVRLMQGHMQESLQQHEAVMREHLDSQLGTHFAQVRQAVQDSREVNVVLHSLEEMQQMGMLGAGGGTSGSGVDGQVQHVHLAQGGAGGHHSRVGDEKGEELAKVLSAVVTFMDGVNTELGVMRGQLGRLEAARRAPAEPVPGAPVFASDAAFPYSETAGHSTSGTQGEGEPALYPQAAGQGGYIDRSGSQQQQQPIEEEGSDERHGGLGRPSREGVSPGKHSWWGVGQQHWSPERAAGVAAAVGSGVGAVVGALLVAYFSSR